MLKTRYKTSTNRVSFPIPLPYVGKDLEIIITVINPSFPKSDSSKSDASFGAWADMSKTAEVICSEIRESRKFREREIVL